METSTPDNLIPSSPVRKRRWWVYTLLACALLLVVFIIVAVLTLRAQMHAPIHLGEAQIIHIRRGTSFRFLANRLYEDKIIPNPVIFYLYARLSGQANKLKIGDYAIKDGMCPLDILAMVNSGLALAYPVTIPEGKWASEYPGFIHAHWPDAAAAWPDLCANPKVAKDVAPFIDGDSLEGYLFPDTYLFDKTASATLMLETMLKRFHEQCITAYQAHPPADGRTIRQVLILASLIEAEAKHDNERPVIAGVYLNRLHKRMLLQCDATILYAHRQRLKRVLFKDLEIDSPYNTYKYPGLPAGPICNPGLPSFMAALHPADVSYLYYVAQGDGSHLFSNTLAEHEAAILRVRGK